MMLYFSTIVNMCFFTTVKIFIDKSSLFTAALTSASKLASAKSPTGFIPTQRHRLVNRRIPIVHRKLFGNQHQIHYEQNEEGIVKNSCRNSIRVRHKDCHVNELSRGIQTSATKLYMTKSPHSEEEGMGDENMRNKSVKEFTQLIQEAYVNGDTDDVLDIAPDLHKVNFSGDEIISIALEAASHNKGQAAGILNAYIASFRHGNIDSLKSKHAKPDLAWDTYISWEEQSDEIGLYPDLVTFCSTYSVMKDAIQLNDENKGFYEKCALQVLERAERYTKKITGSKRRKLLVSISRRRKENTNVMASDHIDQLRRNYGNDFDVLFENKDCIVVCKPSGMVCFHTHKTTDGKIKKKKKTRTKKKNQNDDDNNSSGDENNQNKADISLEDALIDIGVTLSTLNPDSLGIVHRIDRGTSGCIVLAKNNDAHARLVTNFFTRRANKSYLALLPYECENEEHTIESLEQSGIISNRINGKCATSHYSIVATYGSEAMLVNVETKTGRKHQVRVHCAEGLGRPIILDPLYSASHKDFASKCNKRNSRNTHINTQASPISDEEKNGNKIIHQITSDPSIHQNGRFFLHASSLVIAEFDIDVSSELPQWWNDILVKLS